MDGSFAVDERLRCKEIRIIKQNSRATGVDSCMKNMWRRRIHDSFMPNE